MTGIQRFWSWKVGVLAGLVMLLFAPVFAQIDRGHGATHHEAQQPPDSHQPAWEGSVEGTAYSEFNHHLAGFFIILIGLSELRNGLGMVTLSWARFLLPAALFMVGTYLLIWSDHDAWPIGSLSFTHTFSGDGNGWETFQHKAFGVGSLLIGAIELLRRLGRLRPAVWKIPLPAFAILGGLSLFLHSHGVHPAAHRIALHHAIMGVMAVTAGSSKLFSGWMIERGRRLPTPPNPSTRSPWELAWAALILVIAIQLLLYTE